MSERGGEGLDAAGVQVAGVRDVGVAGVAAGVAGGGGVRMLQVGQRVGGSTDGVAVIGEDAGVGVDAGGRVVQVADIPANNNNNGGSIQRPARNVDVGLRNLHMEMLAHPRNNVEALNQVGNNPAVNVVAPVDENPRVAAAPNLRGQGAVDNVGAPPQRQANNAGGNLVVAQAGNNNPAVNNDDEERNDQLVRNIDIDDLDYLQPNRGFALNPSANIVPEHASVRRLFNIQTAGMMFAGGNHVYGYRNRFGNNAVNAAMFGVDLADPAAVAAHNNDPEDI